MKTILSFLLIACTLSSLYGQSLTLLPGQEGQLNLPIYTEEQLKNLSHPEIGTIAYNSTKNCQSFFNGSSWRCMGQKDFLKHNALSFLRFQISGKNSLSEIYDVEAGIIKGVYALVKIKGFVNVNGEIFQGNSSADFLLIKADSILNPIWIKKISFTGDNFHLSRIKINADGNLLLTGNYKDGTLSYHGNNLQSHTGNPKSFLLKIDHNSGNLFWNRKLASSGFFKTYDVVESSNGNICLTGRYEGTPSVLGTNLSTHTGAFLMALNQDATSILHLKNWKSNSNILHGKFIDKGSNSVSIVSEYNDSLFVGNDTIHTRSKQALLYSEYTFNASQLELDGFSYSTGDTNDSLTVDRFENFHLDGRFSGSQSFFTKGSPNANFYLNGFQHFSIRSIPNQYYLLPVASDYPSGKKHTKISQTVEDIILSTGFLQSNGNVSYYSSQQFNWKTHNTIQRTGVATAYNAASRTFLMEVTSPISTFGRFPIFTEVDGNLNNGITFWGLNYFSSYCDIQGKRFEKSPSDNPEAILFQTTLY